MTTGSLENKQHLTKQDSYGQARFPPLPKLSGGALTRVNLREGEGGSGAVENALYSRNDKACPDVTSRPGQI